MDDVHYERCSREAEAFAGVRTRLVEARGVLSIRQTCFLPSNGRAIVCPLVNTVLAPLAVSRGILLFSWSSSASVLRSEEPSTFPR